MRSFDSNSIDENKAGVSLPDISLRDDERLEPRLGITSETFPSGTAAAAVREGQEASQGVIGRLVSLNGTQGLVDCRLDPAGEDWSVGHLITVMHRDARLVGVVCEVATVDARWSEGEANFARMTFELRGEIIDRAPDPSVFHRGVRTYPSLGARRCAG